MRFYFARSARRHRIGKSHANAGIPTTNGNTLEWIANDDRGIELHIKGKPAQEDPNLIIIFHIMPTDL